MALTVSAAVGRAREQLVEPGGRVVGDGAQYVGEPSLRIDVVEFGRAAVAFPKRERAAVLVGDVCWAGRLRGPRWRLGRVHQSL